MAEDAGSTQDKADDAGWEACPGGEISSMVIRVARRRRLMTATRCSAVAVLLLGGLGLWQLLPAGFDQASRPDGEHQFGSICCSDVMNYAAAFQKGELDAEKTDRIRQHLAECPQCRSEIEKHADKSHSSAKLNLADPFGTPIAAAAGLPGLR